MAASVRSWDAENGAENVTSVTLTDPSIGTSGDQILYWVFRQGAGPSGAADAPSTPSGLTKRFDNIGTHGTRTGYSKHMEGYDVYDCDGSDQSETFTASTGYAADRAGVLARVAGVDSSTVQYHQTAAGNVANNGTLSAWKTPSGTTDAIDYVDGAITVVVVAFYDGNSDDQDVTIDDFTLDATTADMEVADGTTLRLFHRVWSGSGTSNPIIRNGTGGNIAPVALAWTFEASSAASQNIDGTAIASAETHGGGAITIGAVNLTGSAIASAEAFGTGEVIGPIDMVGAAIASAEAHGTGAVSGGVIDIDGAAIGTAEAHGTGTVTGGEGEDFEVGDGYVGDYGPSQDIAGQAIASAETHGEGAITTGTTHTVKASGGDFTSLNAALNAIGTAVLPGDTIVTYRTSDTTTISVAGKSADPPVTIRPATPAENGGVALDAVVGSASNDSTYSACSGITWDCTRSSSRIRFDALQAYSGCSNLQFLGDLSSAVDPTWMTETDDTGTLWIQYGLRIRSAASDPVDNVEVDGVRALHRGSRNSTGQVAFKFDGTYANTSAGVWSTNLTVRGCDIGHYASDGIQLQGFDGVTIEDCHIHDIYAAYSGNTDHVDGIHVITGEDITIRRCHVHHVLYQGIWAKTVADGRHDNVDHIDGLTVSNCLIHDLGYSHLVGAVTPAIHSSYSGTGGTLIGFHNTGKVLLSHTIAVDGASGAYGVSLAHNSQAADAWSAMEVDVRNCVFDFMVVDTALSGQSLSNFESSGRFSHRNNLQVLGSPSYSGSLVGAGTADLTAGTDPDWDRATFFPWSSSPLLGAGTAIATLTGLTEDATDYGALSWDSPPAIGVHAVGASVPWTPTGVEVLATPSASGSTSAPTLLFSGCDVGDVLVVAARLNASLTWTPPGGWSQQEAFTGTGDQPHVRVLTHTVTTAGDVTFSGTLSTGLSWDLAGWRVSGLASATAEASWVVDGDSSVIAQTVTGAALSSAWHCVIVATAIPATAGWIVGHAADATPVMAVSHTLPRMVTAHRVQGDGTAPDVETSWTSPSAAANSVMVAFAGAEVAHLIGTAIASAEAHCIGVIDSGGTSLTGTAIASVEVHGTGAITPGAVALTGTAIASAEAFGTGTIATGVVNLTGTAIASAEAHGTGTVTLTSSVQDVDGQAIASAEAHGTGAVSLGAVNVTGAAVVSAEVHGTGTVTLGTTIVGSALASGEAHGTGAVSIGDALLAGQAIASAEAHGTGAIATGTTTVGGQAIASAETFGLGQIVLGVLVIGASITTGEAHGTGAVAIGAPPARRIRRSARRPDMSQSAREEGDN